MARIARRARRREPTGPLRWRTLTETDVAVLSISSGPDALRGDVPEELEVIQKLVLDLDSVAAIQYAADRRAGAKQIDAQRRLVEFSA